jgi:uncharacterized damage-inducible protein DinB
MSTPSVAAPPQYPAGPYEAATEFGAEWRDQRIEEIARSAARLRAVVEGLDDRQLDTKYRNWTVRQIVHHLADSTANAYVRFRLALTESTPTVKPYNETAWAELPDAKQAPIEPSLAIYEGLCERWVDLMRSIDDEQLERDFYHPEQKTNIKLFAILGLYAWHAAHHTAQIEWLADQHGWRRRGR